MVRVLLGSEALTTEITASKAELRSNQTIKKDNRQNDCAASEE